MTSMNLTIRAADAGDIASIAVIAEAADLFAADMVGPMIEGYLEGSTADIWMIALEAERPVGFMFCEPERLTKGTWNLLAIGVMPDAQQAGIGAVMLARLEGLLMRKRARLLLVETMGTPEFEATRRFYRRNGFEEEARIREFYAPGEDKIVFRKAL